MPRAPNLAERRVIVFLNVTFSIDDEGRIWRLRRNGLPCSRHRAESRTKGGYLQVCFEGANVYAHRLVYQHFVGDIPEGRFVNHKNGNKSDNRPENLEIVTHAQNHAHSYAVLGRRPSSGHPKLTPAKVAEIRRRAAAGASDRELATGCGVVYQTILAILHGRTWRTPEAGYDPIVHVPPARSIDRGYKLSATAEAAVLRRAAAGEPYHSIAADYRVSVGAIRDIARRSREGRQRTTERLQKPQHQISPLQLDLLRSFALRPRELVGGSANGLFARGWLTYEREPGTGGVPGIGAITPAGRDALRTLEEREGRLAADARAQGRQ